MIFETAKDAQQAVSLYNGFDWYGRTLEVREVSPSCVPEMIMPAYPSTGPLCWS